MDKKTLSNIFKGDKVIWMIFFFLCIISVVEVFSASSGLTYKSGSYFSPLIKHLGILLMGIFCMVITLNIKCKYFKILTPFMLVISFITLIWVFFAGQSTNGAQRWVSFIGIQFQPSEIAKGTLVLATAQILSALQTDHGADKNAFKFILIVCAFIVPLIGLENLSTAALLCLVILLMMVIGRVPMRQLGKLMGVTLALILVIFAGVMLLGTDRGDVETSKNMTEQVAQQKKDEGLLGKIFHRADTWKSRIDKFTSSKEVTPAEVDLDTDAQVAHANIAIASSNVVGKGPGNSVERDFLSQAFSDFIYAIIIEELGVEGAVAVAVLYIMLLFRTGRIASRCENNFPALLAMGLALLLVTQALFNMCVAVGLAPVTGQPLPLISKGGTSTMINCIYVGVILSVSRSAKKKGEPGQGETKTEVSITE
ncbi:MAG: FtsW/RodA/SpoVE family cell cycle protein [Prevotella salivae]|jgi:putative cell division protein ftsW|uniref:Probable peptidoglycan glycosyltransferase FtsW n=1 Tax=Segatella salivae F0493 TaxID=1395125 RepID=U2M861_9BACT|nr:FtsW/RodA/SpoVE family cell cycle protein [Segatella salivae]ERJ97914.1 cell cycle protein, FtsW/RodA/SpoVE family [Segatella salivae F0493]MBF1531701.1 FtsW/RodA/SpoVE family cell cycle protein [Segatella salivae]MBF1535865.1 FtsW/RodA/SpoVE family cell cycle protein [Segatella salivae]MBF1540087.1 FtsW/RodA/SpoVE family cell cycle protein [Segatella salivae]MBF1541791.1 FtsW/RodA/SpoVE family cell cycle protein [Segatella salivae]